MSLSRGIVELVSVFCRIPRQHGISYLAVGLVGIRPRVLSFTPYAAAARLPVARRPRNRCSRTPGE